MTGPGLDWRTETLQLDPPRAGEVLVRVAYAGLCRSDEHRRHGLVGGGRFPLIGGHEGSGVVVEVGPGVTNVAPGDHIVFSVSPQCGRCEYCRGGQPRMCGLMANVMVGEMLDGTFRARLGEEGIGGFCMVGSFADHVVVTENTCIRIDESLPLDVAALLSCCVPTGWGSAVYTGGVQPGETVVVLGVGGVGLNAVQGAAFAGASHVIAVDPVPAKRELAAKLGATHTTDDLQTATDLARTLSRGTGAQAVIVTVGVLDPEITAAALEMVGKQGRLVLTSASDVPDSVSVQLVGTRITFYDITIRGSLLGGCTSHADIPKFARLYQEGHLQLDELISHRYSLDQVAQGYQDLLDGTVIRGLVEHRHG